MFPLELRCPLCETGLMAPSHMIHGFPSVKVRIRFQQETGEVFLSSLYGDFYGETSIVVPNKTVVQFSCPHCGAELPTASDCRDCGAAMVKLSIGSGGEVEICSRRGCRRHSVLFGDLQYITLNAIMARDVVYVYEDTPLVEVVKMFRREHYRELPVVSSEQRPVGVIYLLSLLQCLYPAELGEIQLQTFASNLPKAEWQTLAAQDVMVPIQANFEPETAILDAGFAMIRENVQFAVITKGSTLVGVLTIGDVARAFIDRKMRAGE